MAKVDDATVQWWNDLVKRVANKISRDHTETDRDDVAQELWLNIISSSWFSNEEDLSESIVYNKLWYLALSYVTKERKVALHRSPEYNYRVQDLSQLLEYWFRKEYPTEKIDEPYEGQQEHDDSLTRVTEMSDISAAWEVLREEYKELLYRYYVKGERFEGTPRRTLQRAKARLCDLLNTPKAGRPRRVRSNAADRADIRNSHDGY